MAAAKEKTFYDKVMDFITGGDERKINRFYKKFIKDNQEQIDLREKDIENEKERILEIDEELREALFKLDIEKIDTIDATNTYVSEYRNSALKVLAKKKQCEKNIKQWEDEINQFTALNDLLPKK